MGMSDISKGEADYLKYRFKQYLGSVSREIQNRRLKEQKMGMRITIDEIIAKEKEIAGSFQYTVDTHMVNSDWSLEEMYCDDTDAIEERLKECKELSDYHNTIANTMSKYKKIWEIVKNTQQLCSSYGSAFIDIREVIKDGNDNNRIHEEKV